MATRPLCEESELDELVRKQVANTKKKKAVELTERERAILELLEEDEVVNLGRVPRLKRSSNL
jgi:hypothetical protein